MALHPFLWVPPFYERRNVSTLRGAAAPNLHTMPQACAPKNAAPAPSCESRTPQGPSLTCYANLYGQKPTPRTLPAQALLVALARFLAVALAVGKDPVVALIDGGFLPAGDSRPSTVQALPDVIIFAEAARRAGELTADSILKNWRDEK